MFHSLAFVALSALISAFAAIPPTSTSPTPVAPAVSAAAAVQVSGYGSTGVHGALIVAPSATRVIDLASEGTFDSVNWVVRFDYTLVDIGNNSTVTFTNHPSRAPVAWIVQGNVTIGQGAVVDLSGKTGTNTVNGYFGYAEPGPGGFRGGRSTTTPSDDTSSAGFGLGGALRSLLETQHAGCGGSYGSVGTVGQNNDLPGTALAGTYGGPAVFQLIGGSGGSAARYTLPTPSSLGGGGGGGGALLIAADGVINVAGTLRANGGAGATNGAAPFVSVLGGGGGSGGAVRLASLVQVTVSGSGAVEVIGGLGGQTSSWVGGNGGFGRVRIEAPSGVPDIFGSVSGPLSLGVPEVAFRTQPPRVWVAAIGGVATPAEAGLEAGLGFGGEPADMTLLQPGIVDIIVDSSDLPLSSLLYLRITRAKGHATLLGPVALTSGTSVTFTNVDLTAGFSALQARAVLP